MCLLLNGHWNSGHCWNLVLPLTLKKIKHVAYFVCVSIVFNMHRCMYIVCSCLFAANCPALSHAWWLLSLFLCTPLRHVGGGWNYSSTHSHLKININFLPSRVLFWYLASNYKVFFLILAFWLALSWLSGLKFCVDTNFVTHDKCLSVNLIF